MTDSIHERIAAVAPEYGHARVEKGADALVRLRTQAPSVSELPADEQKYWRRDARAVLDAAGLPELMRELAKTRHMDRMSTRHALKAEQEVAEVAAKLANREAEVARVEGEAAGLRVKLHDVISERDTLVEAIASLISLSPEKVTEAYRVHYTHHRRPQAGDRVEDGGVMGTLVRCATCSGDGLLHQPDELPPTVAPQPETPPPAVGQPARPAFGDRVRVHCGATGRYVTGGLALVVSAQDNDLLIDHVNPDPDEPPHPTLPVPSDDALAGAFAGLTTSHTRTGAL